jgi:hypothetical protein
MKRGTRLAILAGGVAAVVIGAAGWVSAQQSSAPAATPPPAANPTVKPTIPVAPPPAASAEQPPPPDSAIKAAVAPASPSSEAADVEPDVEPSSTPAAKAAADKPVQPMTRPRYAIAVLQAMDKVTAETMRFEAPVGKPIRYKSLVFIVRACETTAPDEAITDAAAHVEIDSQPLPQEGAVAAPARQLFRGWMFANAPGLNLFQNPAYDAWVIACKTASPAA